MRGATMENQGPSTPGPAALRPTSLAPADESAFELLEDDEEFQWLAGMSPLASAPQAEQGDIDDVTRHANDASRVEDDEGADDEAATAGRASRYLSQATATGARLTPGGDEHAHDRRVTIRPRAPGPPGIPGGGE